MPRVRTRGAAALVTAATLACVSVRSRSNTTRTRTSPPCAGSPGIRARRRRIAAASRTCGAKFRRATKRLSRPLPSTARPPLREENRVVGAYLGADVSSNSCCVSSKSSRPTRNTKGPLAPDLTDARRFVQTSKAKYSEIRKRQPGGRYVWGVLRMDRRKQSFRTVGEGEGARRKAKRLALKLNELEQAPAVTRNRFLSWHEAGEPLPLDRTVRDFA